LKRYQQRFPNGKFVFQSEVIVEDANRTIIRKQQQSPPSQQKRPQALPPAKEGVITIAQQQRPKIRVQLYSRAKRIQVWGDGLKLMNQQSQPLWQGRMAVLSFRREQNQNGLRMTQGYTSRRESPFWGRAIHFSAKTPITIAVGSKKNKKVRGDLWLLPRKNGFRVLNIVDMESYLRGVVPAESYASWPLETLKAQAVAARTYAYYKIRHRKKKIFDVFDDARSQAYGGVNRERKKTDKAVRQTHGQFLTDQPRNQSPRPILTMYSANSGGHTADPQAMFQFSKPYLVAQKDPWSENQRMSTWRRSYSAKKIANALRRTGLSVRNVHTLEPVKIGP
ncbi:SpoIID/LytB domain-containing protein, partial [Magnetococcales bacterium HHB-1]